MRLTLPTVILFSTVILSGGAASPGEAAPQSKDLYPLYQPLS
jgi:hypothetical protein